MFVLTACRKCFLFWFLAKRTWNNLLVMFLVFLHNFCIEAINDYAIFDTDLQKVKKISKPSGIIKKISTCMAMLVISTSIWCFYLTTMNISEIPIESSVVVIQVKIVKQTINCLFCWWIIHIWKYIFSFICSVFFMTNIIYFYQYFQTDF